MELLHDGFATITCAVPAERIKGASEPRALVCISYRDLLDPTSDLSAQIEEAFGSSGLGALSVSHVPHFEEKRKRLLALAQKFAALPEDVKRLYEDPASSYNFGWSHGMESLANGKKDLHKASFYANPIVDEPAVSTPDLVQRYPAYFRPNIWPKEHLSDLEFAFKDLGCLVVEVGKLLTAHCDSFMESKREGSSGPARKLVGVLQRSQITKGRLLHYFPTESVPVVAKECRQAQHEEQSEAWCGWHTDHGSLTGLTSAMYLDESGNEVNNPDPQSGLYIQSREGGVVKANIPPSHIAYQVGESMQIHSGGLLKATPHYVRAPSQGHAESTGVCRNTFAVFMQPDALEPMEVPSGVLEADVAVGQWRAGQDFGQFSVETFKRYYQ